MAPGSHSSPQWILFQGGAGISIWFVDRFLQYERHQPEHSDTASSFSRIAVRSATPQRETVRFPQEPAIQTPHSPHLRHTLPEPCTFLLTAHPHVRWPSASPQPIPQDAPLSSILQNSPSNGPALPQPLPLRHALPEALP